MPDNVRRIARDLIIAGAWRASPTTRINVFLCGERITGPIEFRLRFGNDTALHVHGRCHDAWLAGRQALKTP